MKLVFSAEARADLLQIGDFIAHDSPARAFTFVEELEARCRALPATPLAYPLLAGREASGIRRLVHGNYLIFYQVLDEAVVVLHVLWGARDYEPLLVPKR
ncbi:type II toxin-antitoxin system RelE/ParE family toxin [Methylosinus sp. LW3]|uniref:type II toxin-antitoxin system RelE/ParE family toxin n=1 Tax=Methylosinus sp. LW3 TaxID=107635 RepID=UPI0004659D56|nr:type II toxin-antitoxin system RelE/ParE family toxin [Methylosinus sp. LW3]